MATAVPLLVATVVPNWCILVAPGVSPLVVALGGSSWLLEAPPLVATGTL